MLVLYLSFSNVDGWSEGVFEVGSNVVYQIVFSTYNQRVRGSILPSAYTPRRGILSTFVSLDLCVVNGVPGRNLFLEVLQRHWQQGLKPG